MCVLATKKRHLFFYLFVYLFICVGRNDFLNFAYLLCGCTLTAVRYDIFPYFQPVIIFIGAEYCSFSISSVKVKY